MNSLIRYFTRPTRATKYRIQLIIFIVALCSIGLFLYIQKESQITKISTREKAYQTHKIILEEHEPREEVPLPPKSGNCAYKNCPKVRDDVINVHIICHTHLDPGWLNTVDGYFFGIQHNREANNNGHPYRFTMPSVLTIFNNVVAGLLENSQRRFVMAEMSFISRWWKRLDEDYKQIIRKLMNDGRIDIAGGSWVSNDEAVSHYSAMIDQCTLGFRFIKNELQTCPQPTVAWQLDLFGHGREINSLFAQMGYDGILFGRLDYQEKQQRTNERKLQMLWKVNENAPDNERWLFTGILPNLYHPPETLSLKPDTSGALLRPSDVETIPESATVYSRRLLEELKNQHTRYGTNNIAVIYGGDFEYEDATKYFQNIDAMIDTFNRIQNKSGNSKTFRAHYSTPTCFLHALSQEKQAWPVREGDFMSYAHRAHAFWTGFYTSRPGIKFYERSLGAFYQSLRQLSMTTDQVDFHSLFQLGEIMGLMQHHDTITGTSPSVSIEDAIRRMYRAEQLGRAMALPLYQRILTPDAKANWSTPLIFCHLNESYCEPLSDVDKFSAIVYNPSSVSNQVWLRIPVTEQQTITIDNDNVKKASMNVLEIGTMPLSPIYRFIPLKFKRTQQDELVVRVSVPPLSLQAVPFIVSKRQKPIEPLSVAKTGCSIENKYYILSVDQNGLITSIKVKSINKDLEFQHSFAFYKSSPNDRISDQASGLYVFRPVGTDPPPKLAIKEFYCTKLHGYEEIVQVYSTYANQAIRLLNDEPYIEIDWVVGRLDLNVELVTSYQIKDFGNNEVFYTDSSGRSLMKRTRNQRDGYNFSQSEPSAGNYYPLVTGIIIKDEKKNLQLSVVTDRAEGGGSMRDGQIEIMIHRRVAFDDGLGVSETLNEVGVDNQGLVVRGRHLLSIASLDEGMKFFREHALKSAWKPIIAFRNDNNDVALDYKPWSLLKSALPAQVNILTLEPISQEQNVLTIIFRIEHIYDHNEHSKLSVPISLNIHDIFKPFNLQEVKEVTLGANMNKADRNDRLKWTFDPQHTDKAQPNNIPVFNGKTILLRPMQIRSFIIKLVKSTS